jgi:hypothetical protein
MVSSSPAWSLATRRLARSAKAGSELNFARAAW